jgi:hypothetical protein
MDIPDWIKKRSSLCRSLKEEGIDINSQFKNENVPIKDDDSINNLDDLFLFIKIVKYWDIDIPKSFFKFIYSLNDKVEFFHRLDELSCNLPEHEKAFYEDLKCFADDREIKEKFIFFAKRGNYLFINYLHKLTSYNKWDINIINASINIECFKFFIKKGYNWGIDTIKAVIENGNLDYLKFLHNDYIEKNKNFSFFTSSIMQKAVEKENVEIIHYLINNNCPCNDLSFSVALKNGNLKILTILFQNYTHPSANSIDSALTEAVKKGYFDCIDFIHESKIIIIHNICELAIYQGNMEYLLYFEKKGFKLPSELSIIFKLENEKQFECVKYCFEKGTKLTGTFYSYLLMKNKLEYIKYFHMEEMKKYKKCSWNESSIRNALNYGREEIKNECFTYLIENVSLQASATQGCPIGSKTFFMFISEDNIDVFKCLYEKKSFSFNEEIVNEALKYKSIKIIKFMSDNNCIFYLNDYISKLKIIEVYTFKQIIFSIENIGDISECFNSCMKKHFYDCAKILKNHKQGKYIAISNEDIKILNECM